MSNIQMIIFFLIPGFISQEISRLIMPKHIDRPKEEVITSILVFSLLNYMLVLLGKVFLINGLTWSIFDIFYCTGIIFFILFIILDIFSQVDLSNKFIFLLISSICFLISFVTALCVYYPIFSRLFIRLFRASKYISLDILLATILVSVFTGLAWGRCQQFIMKRFYEWWTKQCLKRGEIAYRGRLPLFQDLAREYKEHWNEIELENGDRFLCYIRRRNNPPERDAIYIEEAILYRNDQEIPLKSYFEGFYIPFERIRYIGFRKKEAKTQKLVE